MCLPSPYPSQKTKGTTEASDDTTQEGNSTYGRWPQICMSPTCRPGASIHRVTSIHRQLFEHTATTIAAEGPWEMGSVLEYWCISTLSALGEGWKLTSPTKKPQVVFL